jgi:hypothetical protein
MVETFGQYGLYTEVIYKFIGFTVLFRLPLLRNFIWFFVGIQYQRYKIENPIKSIESGADCINMTKINTGGIITTK